MKRVVFLLLLIFSINQAFSQITMLEDAYKKKSKEKLDEFFEYWRKDVPPISEEEFQNLSDTIKEVYSAFGTFYQPLSLSKLGKSEWGDSIYQNVDYLIVQTILGITIREKVFFTKEDIERIDKEIETKYDKNGIDSIRHGLPPFVFENASYHESYNNKNLYSKIIEQLRPNVSIHNKKAVYLTPLYDIGLTTFLGTQIKTKKNKPSYVRYLSSEKVNSRQKFLEQNVKIWRGHWSANWRLISFPQIYSIVFDKDFQYAKILFRIVYQGGEAILKKEDGEWKILSSELTWIE